MNLIYTFSFSKCDVLLVLVLFSKDQFTFSYTVVWEKFILDIFVWKLFVVKYFRLKVSNEKL